LGWGDEIFLVAKVKGMNYDYNAKYGKVFN
jgi:hypothetical protein